MDTLTKLKFVLVSLLYLLIVSLVGFLWLAMGLTDVLIWAL